MKIIDRIKYTVINTRKGVNRFPVTIALSILLTLMLIYQHEISPNMLEGTRENLTRLNMIIGLGIPLSLSISLLNEGFSRGKKSNLIGYLAGGVLLFFYYNFLLKDFSMVSITRYIGTMLFVILVFLYSHKLTNYKDYEKYLINVFSSGFITVLYCGVLYVGLAAILLTIDSLFDVYIDSDIYYYIFLIVTLMFGISLFLSKLPNRDSSFVDNEYSKSLKVLLLYIVIPLITVYTLILYAYFIKILINWNWPKGLVSHLVLWYSVISVGVIFLITPLIEENKVAKIFKDWFPKVILPILFMMFISIWQRINQYGITENRYYVLILGLWVLGIMIYFSIKKTLKNIIIPISLSAVVLLSIYGPLSSFTISKMSQNSRLNKLLESEGMIANGVIASTDTIDSDKKKEINNILDYFNRYHKLSDIRILSNEFELADTKDVFGFEFSSYNPNQSNEEYFNYYVTPYQIPIDIEGFDYYINVSSWNSKNVSIDSGMNLSYNTNEHILTIKDNDSILIEQDINELVEDIHSKSKLNQNFDNNIGEMTFDIENETINIRIIFTNLSSRYNINNERLNVESAEFLLLINKRY